MPTAAVASPPSPLLLPARVVPPIVSPPSSVPQPLATVVPIISVVTSTLDTPMEAPVQVLAVGGQTHQVDVMFLLI